MVRRSQAPRPRATVGLRKATREALGLSRSEYSLLRRLRTPERIQAYLYGLRQNFEPDGDTCNSVRTVLRNQRAHCIEGAMLAAGLPWLLAQAKPAEVGPAGASAVEKHLARAWSGDRRRLDLARL